MNHLVLCTSVQENTNVWGELTTFFNIFRVSTTTAVTPVVQCRFTDAPWLATTGGRKNFMGTVSYSSKLSLKDCWFPGPNPYSTNPDSPQLPSVPMTTTLSLRCV